MKLRNVSPDFPVWFLTGALAAGCVGQVQSGAPKDPLPSPGGGSGVPSVGSGGGTGSAGGISTGTGTGNASGTGGGNGAGTGGTGMVVGPMGPRDPGRVTMRQLNRAEYNNTVRDLLLTTQQPGLTFLNDAPAFGFDNNADHLSVSPVLAGLYQKAAESLAAEAIVAPARSRIITCDLAAAGDTCQRTIITNFGAKAYRRPLTAAEISSYLALMAKARTAGATPDEAVRTAIEAFLMSPSFLHRVEFDPDPTSVVPHQVAPYEMASRLSYLAYRSMPDQMLFDAAAAGKLTAPADIQAQLTRLLADQKGIAFSQDFSAQWLGVVPLDTVQFDLKLFPKFTTPLAVSMKTEIASFFDAFLKENLPVTQLLTAKFSYLDSALAAHYGLPAVPAGAARRVDLTTPQRGGLLTMAGTLAVTSYMTRTSLAKRGAYVAGQFLCAEPPPPPNDVPPFPDNGMVMGTQRQILEMHRTNPSCAACHIVMDNIGIALENYDAVGAWRTNDTNGGLIDANGELNGVKFNGGQQMAAVIAADPRFTPCLAEKMLTYALGREVTHVGADAPYVKEIAADTPAGQPGLREIVNRVVASETFNMRHGEP